MGRLCRPRGLRLICGMVIERDTVGRIHKATNGKYYYQSKFEDGTTVRAREKDWWTAAAFRTLDRRQRKKPVGLLNLGDLSWWMYKGKHYLTDGHPRPTELLEFLESLKILADFRNEKFFPKSAAYKLRTIGKRKPPGVPLAEIVKEATGEHPAAPKKRKQPKVKKPGREYIPSDVKIFVWRRDEGRCVECNSREHLEYDHIIPIAKGGSNTARNLQLLCERCNRKKGASIA